MRTVIRLLARVVERFPVAVVLVSLLLTGMFGWFATDVRVSTGQEGFAPDSEEILAAERIGELFGDEAVQSVMQVIVRAPGGDVISPEGYAVTRTIAEALEREVPELLASNGGQPPIVSFLAPVELAALESGVDPTTLDDAAFSDLYADVLASGGDELGFVRIDEQLRSVSHPQVFATGDCASWSGQALPKAGVHAVRMGPVLASNLRAALRVPAAAGDLQAHRPQRHFLALLATGDGRAIASRGPFGAEGAWAWRWKDRIDRRFLQQFVATQATPPHASQPAQPLNSLAEVSARHSGESQ
jgi:hypothetical protein